MKVQVADSTGNVRVIDHVESVIPPGDKFPFWSITKSKGLESIQFINMYQTKHIIMFEEEGDDDGAIPVPGIESNSLWRRQYEGRKDH